MRLGGMVVTTPHLNTEAEYNASRLLTKDIMDPIISQNTEYKPSKERISETTMVSVTYTKVTNKVALCQKI